MDVCELMTVTITCIEHILEDAGVSDSQILETNSNGLKHEAFSKLAGQLNLATYQIAFLIKLNGRWLSDSFRSVSGKDTYCEVAICVRRRTGQIEYTYHAAKGNRRAQLKMAGKRLQTASRKSVQRLEKSEPDRHDHARRDLR
jgi:hypothetical protein